MSTSAKLFARAEAERARIEAGGGPVERDRATYLAACGAVDNARRQQETLGFLPVLGVLWWAVAALAAVGTVAASVAVVRSIDTATEGVQEVTKRTVDVVNGLLLVAGIAGGVWIAAKIAPEVSTNIAAARRVKVST